MFKRAAHPYAVLCIAFCCVISCSSSPRYKRGRTYTRPSQSIVQEQNDTSKSKGPVLRGVASYYSSEFHGKKTASGELYDMHDFTAAHPTLPFNTRISVTNLSNNTSVIVRINDRGPHARGRIIDVSLAAAKELGLIRTGTAEVELKIVK